MKTSNLIIAALSAALLSACDKPTPTVEAPITATPISEVHTYTEDRNTSEIVPKKTDIYVYSATTSISFDTTEADNWIWYNRMFYHPSEGFIYHSDYDTVHTISLKKGDYQIIIDNQIAISEPNPLDEVQDNDTVRWFHIHKVSVGDTLGFVLVDTFYRKEFLRQNQ